MVRFICGIVFFFFKRKTAYEMLISDWSSDVCSSDLDMLGWQAEASFAAGSRMAISRFLRNMLQSGALGLGALLAIDGQISGGAIFASSFLLGRAVAPVDQLVGSWRSFVAARASHGEIMAWLDGATDDAPQTSLPRPKGRVDVERVTVEDSHSQIGRAHV